MNKNQKAEKPDKTRAQKKTDLHTQNWLFLFHAGIIIIWKGGMKMLKDNTQTTLDLSPYQGLYDAIIPKNHILRKLKDNIDFSFVIPMLRKQYCEHFGRPAKEPEMMFTLLFLKKRLQMKRGQMKYNFQNLLKKARKMA